MFGSEILEVAVGIGFLYLLLSLVCSAITEGVHFIEKTVESSRSDEKWLNARWRAPGRQHQTL